ncbi:hypothetical protein ACFQU7_00850 [Pseudoroseomonas wenyumeiae]
MSDFDDNLSIGAQHPLRIADYLDEIGDHQGAQALRLLPPTGQSLGLPGAAWLRTGVKIGYVANGTTERRVAVTAASSIEPDKSLIGRQIKLSLDELYIESHPGLFGEHKIICEFAGKNQSQAESEEVRFALTAFARDQSGAAIRGAPIFVGLTVGADGLAFKGKTVNVQNPDDDWLVGALGSDTFKNGLALITTVQPVLKPFAKLAADAVTASANRHKNRQVMTFTLGLDFSQTVTSAKLRLGSYVVVQGDDAEWAWNDVTLDTESNRLVLTASGKPLARNYMVIGVSEAAAASAVKPPRRTGA